jgi:hypothetical protein
MPANRPIRRSKISMLSPDISWPPSVLARTALSAPNLCPPLIMTTNPGIVNIGFPLATEINLVNVYANHISETKETSPKQGLSDRFIL